MRISNAVPVALLFPLLLLAGAAASRPAAVGPSEGLAAYAIDSIHSTALFRVHHLGAGQFWGRFNDLQGEMVVDDAGEPQRIDVTISIDSVDTNNDNLDKHLKSPDFFSSREHPEMTFTTKSIEKTGEGAYKVTGDLTIRGTTREIAADLEHTGTRGERIGYEARFTVKRSEYGVSYGVENGALGDETKVIVGLEGKAAAADE